MNWIISFFKSSLGQKIIMSLTGLFLIIFLLVHLAGNLSLLSNDGGDTFNSYAYFMTSNPLIKTVSWGLYAFILLHAIQGIVIWMSNRNAKGGKYAVKTSENATWASKNMAMLGILVFAFLCIHMGDFWYKMKFTDSLSMVEVSSYDFKVADLYDRVHTAYQELWIVVVYLVGLIALAFHLLHGFASAFQTLGLRHKKYTPLISFLGKAYAILIPLGFAIIPIYSYFFK